MFAGMDDRTVVPGKHLRDLGTPTENVVPSGERAAACLDVVNSPAIPP